MAADNSGSFSGESGLDEESLLDPDEDEEEVEHNEAADDLVEARNLSGLQNEIDIKRFDELRLDLTSITEAQGAWRLFVSSASSREAAGEAIYAALFEGAPTLQSLFTTPRAVQAARFMNGLASFVMALDEPPKLKVLVESLGFGHLHLEVTIPRVLVFRDAILDLFQVELGSKFTTQAKMGWTALLNYVGGAIIYCKAHYAERINILFDSWKKANAGDAEKKAQEEKEREEAQDEDEKGMKGDKGLAKEEKEDRRGVGVQNIPTNFPDMFQFNAAVMGYGDRIWMNEVLACFHNIVTNVSNSARLQEEADVLALRVQRCNMQGAIYLAEYKSCMLAALRSLLPKDWTQGHEVAWTWLWENVERLLSTSEFFTRGNTLQRALAKLLDGVEEPQKYELRKDIYVRFFSSTPAGQDFFKQSNTYLHLIADKVLDMTLDFYKDPVKMVDDISALGLRHVGYAIPTEHFGPFVTACIEALVAMDVDQVAVAAFRCSLALVAKMLVRTINEGSTIVMKAINTNSRKSLKKAISCAPRGERAQWMLVVQVGTQDISPLSWALESGNLEAASAMIQDLLTIRADRDRYYYAVDDMFGRHEDLVKRLLDEAPALLPELFDGLIWRSRLTENGYRRVNYYLRHLLVENDGRCAKTLEWLDEAGDPRIVCHPMIILLTDMVWANATYFDFLMGKLWLFFTLTVFICSQSVKQIGEYPEAKGFCRVFVYCCSMSQLIYTHVRKFIINYSSGNTCKFLCLTLPGHMAEWQESASFVLAVALFVMFCLEPILECWKDNGGIWFTDKCENAKALAFPYSFCSMLAMFLYYALLIDLSVFSNKISAYILVSRQLASELFLFLLGLCVVMLTLASGFSCLRQDEEEFKGIMNGLRTFLQIVMRMFNTEHYERFHSEPMILIGVFIFILAVVAFLFNLLVAQLTCSYRAVFEDMVGFARLGRVRIIVETLPKITKKRWRRFIHSVKLDERIEFNEGDVGLAGGVQITEPANANPTTIDMIRRFGGSTSETMPWPEEENDGDESDRFERMEKLIHRTMSRISGASGGGGRSRKQSERGDSSEGKGGDSSAKDESAEGPDDASEGSE